MRQIDINVEPVQLLRQMTDVIVQCVNASVEIAVFYFNDVVRCRTTSDVVLCVNATLVSSLLALAYTLPVFTGREHGCPK